MSRRRVPSLVLWSLLLILSGTTVGCLEHRLEALQAVDPLESDSGSGKPDGTLAEDSAAQDTAAQDTAGKDATEKDTTLAVDVPNEDTTGGGQDAGLGDTAPTDATIDDAVTLDTSALADSGVLDSLSSDTQTADGGTDTTGADSQSKDSGSPVDGGGQPVGDQKVRIFATALGQCAVLDGVVWLRGGPPTAVFKPVLGPTQLGFAAHSAWCPTPSTTLVVAGNDLGGIAHIAQLVKPQAPLLKLTLGPGTSLAVHGRETPFDVTVVGGAPSAGPPPGKALGAASALASGQTWGAPTGLAGMPALHDVFVRPDGARVAVGGKGTILGSGGSTNLKAEVTPPNLTGPLFGVWSSPKGPFHAVGAGGVLLRQAPKGWNVAPGIVMPTIAWQAISGFDDGVALAVGGKQIALWHQQQWKALNNVVGIPPKNQPFTGVACYEEGGTRWVLIGHHPVVQRCVLDITTKPVLTCETKPVVDAGKAGPPAGG